MYKKTFSYLNYGKFDQFLHLKQYLPQPVPCMARCSAQNVNQL